MVYRSLTKLLTRSLVLFSHRDKHWKLADFGTAVKATSKLLHTTRFSRGTSCYRAPELLKEDSRFNNKADMFALGCILYEVTTGQKLFSDDWAIREYATKGGEDFPSLWPPCEVGTRLYSLKTLAQSLLEVDPSNRLGAEDTYSILKLIRCGVRIPDAPLLNIRTRTPAPPPQQPPKAADILYRRPIVTNRMPTPDELEMKLSEIGGVLQHPQSGGHSLADYQNLMLNLQRVHEVLLQCRTPQRLIV
jgi:serine/threonine protein kinase